MIYIKTKEQGWKESHGIQNNGIEHSKGSKVVDERQVLKILENRPENLEVEPEKEVDADEKGPYSLQSEVKKTIKEIRDKRDTGNYDVPGDVLKLLEENGLRPITKQINDIYETGE
jgi:hypothetical protein